MHLLYILDLSSVIFKELLFIDLLSSLSIFYFPFLPLYLPTNLLCRYLMHLSLVYLFIRSPLFPPPFLFLHDDFN